MAKTVAQISGELTGLRKDIGTMAVKIQQAAVDIKKLEPAVDALSRDLEKELKEIRDRAAKEEVEARKTYQTKMKAMAGKSTNAAIEVTAAAKGAKMAADEAGKLLAQLKGAKGDDKERKAAEVLANTLKREATSVAAAVGSVDAAARRITAATLA